MTYSFRIRFTRSPANTLQTEERVVILTDSAAPSPLRLLNPQPDGKIKTATELAVTGDGYGSVDEARTAGEKCQAALTIALARHRVGADFGLRAPKAVITDHGIAWLEQQVRQRVLDDIHGLMVYATEPKPRFAKLALSAVRGANLDQFRKTFAVAAAVSPHLSDRETVAFSLFNASFFRQSADSRFVLLMMATEALIDLRPRSDAARTHVRYLTDLTRSAPLSAHERNSILGALRWLASESISEAGRRLATERLGERTYKGFPAARFFTHCYRLRSALVHGREPYPTFDEVASVVAQLEVFVSDLLTVRFLGVPE